MAIGRCQAEVEIDFLTHVRARFEKRIPMVLYRNARHCVGRVAMPRIIGQGKLREYCREGELGFFGMITCTGYRLSDALGVTTGHLFCPDDEGPLYPNQKTVWE